MSKDDELVQNLIDTVEALIDALKAAAEARMPGEARRIAREALAKVQGCAAGRDAPAVEWD